MDIVVPMMVCSPLTPEKGQSAESAQEMTVCTRFILLNYMPSKDKKGGLERMKRAKLSECVATNGKLAAG